MRCCPCSLPEREASAAGGGRAEAEPVDGHRAPAGQEEFVAAAMHQDPATKANLLEKFGKEAVPLFFSRLEKQVKENNGYFVNGKLSWADLYLAAYSKTYDFFFPNIFEPYPALQGVIDKVHAEPNIKIWVEKRPESDF
ncbi:Glutathione S-transferase S1 [Gryllus bimaculatus]|nr:Glutathione S-transferase S1 [Gryllus bimaculatus]